MDFTTARRNMVENQIRTNRVTNSAIIRAFEEVPREVFVPQNLASIAYIDEQLLVAKGRYLLEPMVLAMLLQAAGIGPSDVVLEIGCGTGYSSAILSNLASTVVAIEEDEGLVKQATENLIELGVDNVAIMTGSLTAGYKKQSPYDVIVISGSVAEVPELITAQLMDGGRLVTVFNKGDSLGKGVLITKIGRTISSKDTFEAWTPTLPGFEKRPTFAF